MRSTTLLVVAMSAALAACNQPNANRTTKAPPGVDNPTALVQPLTTPSAPPAPPMRDAVAPSANRIAPGTDASVAFGNDPNPRSQPSQPSKGGAPDIQSRNVQAQEAAAKAPDTASGDAAKKDVQAGNASGLRVPGTSTDTSANEPRHGELTKAEESQQMPKAGQVNNYSSPALEEDSGRGRKP